MDVLEFANKLGEVETDATLGRWVESFQDYVIRQTVYLGRHTSRLPAQLQENYWDILQSALESMPEGTYIEITSDLEGHINAAAPQGIKPLIKARTHVLKLAK